MVFVTAASSNHFAELKRSLGRLFYQLAAAKVIVYDLGFSKPEIAYVSALYDGVPMYTYAHATLFFIKQSPLAMLPVSLPLKYWIFLRKNTPASTGSAQMYYSEKHSLINLNKHVHNKWYYLNSILL